MSAALVSPALTIPIAAQAVSPPAVEVLSHTSWSDVLPNGTAILHVVGQFRNDSAFNVSDVHVAYTLNVSVGSPLASVASATLKILQPGEISPFEDVNPQPANYTGTSLVDGSAASYSLPTSQPYNSLNAGQLSLAVNPCGNLDPTSDACQNHLSGTVLNVGTGAVTADHVTVALTFFSGTSAMVGQNVSSVLKADATTALMPGQMGTFTLDRTGEPAWSGDVASGLLAVAEPLYPVDLNPPMLSFGNQRATVTSPALPVTLTNNGDQTVDISSMTTGKPDFNLVQKCTNIAPHNTCVATVTFTPSTMGPESDALTINDDAPGTAQTLALTGTGVASLVSLAPPSLLKDFGLVPVGTTSNPFTITLTNTGTASLTISGVNITGVNPGDFSEDHSGCPVVLAVSSSCPIVVSFTPTAALGRGPAQLTVVSDAFNASPVFQLMGTGLGAAVSLTPPSVSFGSVNVGSMSSKPISLMNTGNATLTITAIAVNGGFTESDNCGPFPAQFAQNAGCMITATFAPATPITAAGDLSVTDGGGVVHADHLTGIGLGAGASLSTTTLSFGGETVGLTTPTKSVTLTNTGNAPLTITSIIPSPSPVFSETDTCPPSLPATAGSNSCVVNVAFTPGGEGDVTGSLTLTTSVSTLTVTLTGTGLANWASLSGILSSAPAASTWGVGRTDVFVEGADKALWHRAFISGTWGSWESLSGIITTKPAAVSWGANRIDVFVRGGDMGLWHKSTSDAGVTWSDWENLSGKLNSAPTVSSMGNGELDVFALGADNALWQREYANGAWGSWTSLGGYANAAPAAASQGAGLIDVFVRGGDNALWHKSFSNGSWSASWVSLSGILNSAPVATSWGVGRVDVFALGGDNALWHTFSTDGGVHFGTWTSQGGGANADPTAVARGVGLIDLFIRGLDNALWHKTITGS